MFIKAYIKTKGDCQVQFVPAPINMGHVEGNGYLGTIWARILQVDSSVATVALSLLTDAISTVLFSSYLCLPAALPQVPLCLENP